MNRIAFALLPGCLVFLLLFAPHGAGAGILSPRIQWPNYNQPNYGWYQPNYYPQQQTPRPRRAKKKPEEAKQPSSSGESEALEQTTATQRAISGTVRDEAVESANPFHRGGEPSAPTKVAPVVIVPAGDYVSFVWDDSDSLEQIARQCGTTSAELLRLNNLRRGELQDGQVLQVQRPAQGVEGIRSLQPDRQRAREIWRGIRGQKRIALTFDAGGEDDAASDLLKYLVDAKAPATFFVTGQFAAEHGTLLKQIAAAGYPVHNHSWSHPEFTRIDDDKIHEELERTDWAIRDVTSKTTKPYWRPPFGDRDNRVLRVAADTGYQSIYWTIDSLDSVGEKKSPDYIVSRILNPPKANGDADRYLDGAIILMHVGEPGTASAVPVLIRALRERGFQLVSVDDLVTPASPTREKQ